MMQQESPLRNSGARTSDWIRQAKGRVIYAYDLGTLVGETKGKVVFVKEDFEQARRRVSRRVSPSEPDEASSEK